MRPVGQTIQSRGGQQAVLPERLRPLGVIAIAGQQDRPALVALVDDLVEVLRLVAAQRSQAEVVQLCGAPHNWTHVEHPIMWSRGWVVPHCLIPGPAYST
jgi:hypothetical protein